MKYSLVLFFAFFLINHLAQAKVDQTFTITPTTSTENEDNISFDFDFFDQQEIINSNAQSAIDLFSSSADITTYANGPSSHKTSLFLQGSSTDKVLVLLDGIKMNNPSTPGGEFDFSLLDLDNIESIEVLKGPQSGLYGAGALSGVINIKTKQFTRPHYDFTLLGGSHSTYGFNTHIAHPIGNLKINLYAKYKDTKGFSASAGGDEDDGATTQSLALNLRHNRNNIETQAAINYIKKEIDLDAWNGDDPNNTETDEKTSGKVSTSALLFNSKYKTTFSYMFTNAYRHNLNLADSNSTTTSNYIYKANSNQITWNNRLMINQYLTTIIGADYLKDTMHTKSMSERSIETTGIYLQNQIFLGRNTINFNLRYDDSSYNNDFFTYRLGFESKLINSFSIQMAYSYAVKNPTLYQLYSSYGEPTLKEEQQKGGNIAFIFHKKSFKAKFNVFSYKSENLIDYNMTTWKYYNNGESTRKGYSLELQKQIDAFTFKGNYNYLIATSADGEYLVRRPRHKVTLSTQYMKNRFSSTVLLDYIGTRDAYSSGTLPSFVKCDFMMNYKLAKNGQLSLRWNNVLDHRYEMAKGYQTEGSSVYTQLKYTF